MADVLSHPFRLDSTGAVATVTEGSDEANAEAIAVLLLTRKGERDLVPGFGIADPTYAELDVAELNVALDDYGPPVTVTATAVEYPTDTTERVELTFQDR